MTSDDQVVEAPTKRTFKKRYLLAGLVVGGVALAMVGGDDSETPDLAMTDEEGDNADRSSDDNDGSEDPSRSADDSDSESESQAELGTADNPYPFGTVHTREPGYLGAGWSISIDEVRTGISHAEFSSDPGQCLAVIGTATLDSLDSDNSLSADYYSFPSVQLLDDGIAANDSDAIFDCDGSSLDAEGMIDVHDIDIAPGTTVTWYNLFSSTTGEYDTVAIETTIYQAG